MNDSAMGRAMAARLEWIKANQPGITDKEIKDRLEKHTKPSKPKYRKGRRK